jgi:hypothetical protein
MESVSWEEFVKLDTTDRVSAFDLFSTWKDIFVLYACARI